MIARWKFGFGVSRVVAVVAIGLAMTTIFPQSSRASQTICEAADLAVATTPAPPTDPIYMQRHLAVARSVPAEADVVLVGDSMTQGWPPRTAAALFETSRIFNFGENADQTQQVLWRLSSTPGIERLRPREVVILIGTNNLSKKVAPCAIIDGIAAVLTQTERLWHPAKTVVLQILPRGADFQSYQDSRAAVNAAIPALIRGKRGVVTINVDASITCTFTVGCPNYKPDALHLTPTGYVALAAALRPVVSR